MPPKKIYRWVKIASIIRVYLHLPPPFYISPNEKICNMGEDTKSETNIALWERIEHAEHVKGDVIICIQMHTYVQHSELALH